MTPPTPPAEPKPERADPDSIKSALRLMRSAVAAIGLAVDHAEQSRTERWEYAGNASADIERAEAALYGAREALATATRNRL